MKKYILLPFVLSILNSYNLRNRTNILNVQKIKDKCIFKDVVFKHITEDEDPIKLIDYIGKKTIMIVNIASGGGFTKKQYEGLQEIHKKYINDLLLICVPSDSFKQEPKSNAEILEFVEVNFDGTFFLSEKSVVKGEKNLHPFYKIIKEKFNMNVNWNFYKYIITKDLQIEKFSPRTRPTSEKIIQIIEEDLKRIVFKEGTENAPVSMIIYESLTSLLSKKFHENFYPDLKKDYIDTGKIQVEFKMYPHNNNSLEITTSLLSIIAQKENLKKNGSSEIIDKILKEDKTTTEKIKILAENMGYTIDNKQYDELYEDYKLEIEKNKKDYKDVFKVEGTPTFYISSCENSNSKQINGLPEKYKSLKTEIDKILN